MAGGAAHAELVTARIPRGEQVRFELSDSAQVGHVLAILLVKGPDDDATIGRRGEKHVRDGVPLERVHVAVVLFEDFRQLPVFDIRLLVGDEDEDLFPEWADGTEATILVPSETLDAWQDAV